MAKKRRSTRLPSVSEASEPTGRHTAASGMKVCNIEWGMPTVSEAHSMLAAEIRAARIGRWTCFKVIHGYGSSGKGGLIKNSLPAFLDSQMRAGNIRDYIKGENFSIFDALTQRAMLKYPELSGDSDLEKCNHGITIILL